MRALLAEDVEPAVLGGSVLAAGGGGWVDHGRLVGQTATRLGIPRLAGIDEIPDDGIIVTVTAIGSPAAPDWQMLPVDYVRALQLLQEALGRPIAGLITAQNGSSTTLNGWVQSALEQDHVRMFWNPRRLFTEHDDALASAAGATRQAIARLSALETLRQCKCRHLFAHAIRAFEAIGMVNLAGLKGTHQRVNRGALAKNLRKGHRNAH